MCKPQIVYPQAGTITFRIRKTKIEFLIITTRKENYTIPKGIIEIGQTAREAAVQETLEEAGAKGLLLYEIGTYSYPKWQGICRVKVFLMLLEELHETWQEDFFRKRKFVTFKQLDGFLKKSELLDLFTQAYSTIRKKYKSKINLT